eukprot:9834185-Heterocapsa_arctica.AAC.1
MNEVMRAKLWTSHAEEANKEHQVLYNANLRHGRSTVGFHPRDLEVSVGKSCFRHHRLLSLTSSLPLVRVSRRLLRILRRLRRRTAPLSRSRRLGELLGLLGGDVNML